MNRLDVERRERQAAQEQHEADVERLAADALAEQRRANAEAELSVIADHYHRAKAAAGVRAGRAPVPDMPPELAAEEAERMAAVAVVHEEKGRLRVARLPIPPELDFPVARRPG